MSNSTITILGNLTQSPELRTTTHGHRVATFRVASSRGRFVEDQWQDGEPTYLDVDCWEPMGPNVMTTLTSGMAVIVHGRLETSRWTNKEGETRTKMRIRATAVGPDLRRMDGTMNWANRNSTVAKAGANHTSDPSREKVSDDNDDEVDVATNAMYRDKEAQPSF
ncbi:single-stranded DNA-binding protein [Corynebacterium sp. TAE3-ERU12]|uniref:single-stranded DNA-binding protein n=1 Tax=Corynebacterium sp. TAE3-ERU12 TaxID=2849491 RepID=UPI001C450B68|nr:single-stranded DNA-binding protein [Corynebacterium sp. TAE3-ERU12]MBV7294944.1 single-stranded DNA-binding protein [Corynebacterium sp. TAE3-ERU12]